MDIRPTSGREHSGYVPPRSGLWMIPKGFFLIMRHHPGRREQAESFIRKLAARVALVPGLKEFNQAHLASFAASYHQKLVTA